MAFLHSITQVVKIGDLMLSLDLKDTYLHVLIHHQYRKNLHFAVLGFHLLVHLLVLWPVHIRCFRVFSCSQLLSFYANKATIWMISCL